MSIELFLATDGYNYTKYSFICPICKTLVEICNINYTPDTNHSIYTDHSIDHNKECLIKTFLYESDSHWSIKRIEEYKQRLETFFETDEHKNEIKKQIVKDL